MAHINSELPLLGPIDGFYPVEGFTGEHKEQLWIPKGLQDYEALCLAALVEASGYEPTHIVSIARGGLATAQALLYANEVKPALGYQTYGYDQNDRPLDMPIIMSRPSFMGLRKHERKEPLRLLVCDELLDAGKSIKVVVDDLVEQLEPEEIKTGVIYVKDRPHVTEVDFFVRLVQDVWLDHETQASRERREIRLEQLAAYAPDIAAAMGALAVLPARIEYLHAMLQRSQSIVPASS
jgi:hypoxanthine phosphoribosyltransferase